MHVLYMCIPHDDVAYYLFYQFDELTVHPKWEQRLRENRAEHGELLTTLLSPISQRFCNLVMTMENTVAYVTQSLLDMYDGSYTGSYTTCTCTCVHVMLGRNLYS